MRGNSTGFLKPFLIIVGIILVVLIAVFLVAFFMGGDKDMGPAVDFTGSDIQGNSVTLSALYEKGGVALIFFEPTKDDSALLKNLAAAKKDTSVTTVLITPSDSTAITEYLNKYKLSADYIISDADDTIQNLYNVTAFPTTYFIRNDGSVRGSTLSNLAPSAAEKYIGYIS